MPTMEAASAKLSQLTVLRLANIDELIDWIESKTQAGKPKASNEGLIGLCADSFHKDTDSLLKEVGSDQELLKKIAINLLSDVASGRKLKEVFLNRRQYGKYLLKQVIAKIDDAKFLEQNGFSEYVQENNQMKVLTERIDDQLSAIANR